jgi:pimeloyl-ACP methyl ester carboxylesterase
MLVCQDWGGLLGLTLPMAAPQRYTRLLVMNTTLATGELSEGFRAWRAYSNGQPDLAVGRLLRRGTPELTEAEAAAYDAPFPDAAHKAALRAFPNLVPDGAEAPGAALSREALAFWRDRWQGHSFMAVGERDPVLGPPVMAALAQAIRGCPEPMRVAEAGHFVPEWGRPIARAALRHFGLAT